MGAPALIPPTPPPLDPVALVGAVDSFYSNAWDKLVFALGAIAAIVGFVVPFAVQYFQNRRFKSRLDKERIAFEAKVIAVEKRLEGKIAEEQAKVKSEMSAEFANQLTKMKAELARQIAFARAMGFFLQAKSHLANSGSTVRMVVRSIRSALRAVVPHEYDDNANTIVDMLIDDALPLANTSHFASLEEPRLENMLDDILKLLREHNRTGMRTQQIEKLTAAMATAKIRQPPPASPRR